MVRASTAAEQAGVPTASLVCEGFLSQAVTTAAGLGLPHLPLAPVPGHVDVQSAAELRHNILTVTVDAMIRNLTEDLAAPDALVEPEPTDIVCTGTPEEIARFFYDHEWSDGLPIVPPTLARVQAFLHHVDRAPGAELGLLLPDKRMATIWNVAVNGVLAGCRPAEMPVLVAIAEALADPIYGVEHSGDTTGAEMLVILHGPIGRELGFNAGQGALRDGVQANATVGRFTRLYLRNVAGFLPGKTDKGTFGSTWRVVLAEDEEALARLGWPSLGQELGLAPGTSGVTVGRYTTSATIGSVFAADTESMLAYLADGLVKHIGWEWVFCVWHGHGATMRPVLILSPILAQALARAGLSKADVRQRLFTLARLEAWKVERYIGPWTNFVPGQTRLIDLVRQGEIPEVYGTSDDPNRLVPLVVRPDDILLVVAGDPLRTNAHTLVSNGLHGFPTTRAIRRRQA